MAHEGAVRRVPQQVRVWGRRIRWPLLTLVRSPAAAHAFFDSLDCAKGPSLGTNFTLACPYTLYGHWGELEWAAEHGVPEDLIRVSIGMEDTDRLLGVFAAAVQAAERALVSSRIARLYGDIDRKTDS